MGDSVDTVPLTLAGKRIAVPVDQAGTLISQGWSQETPEQRADAFEGQLQDERAPGIVASAGLGLARGATLGVSDKIGNAILGQDYRRFANEADTAHPFVSTGGQLVGGLALGELGGINEAIGSKVAGLGLDEAGVTGRVVANTLEGAGQGAVQNAGAYVADTALGDRSLSADGFVGAMGDGAMWGGVAGGALSLSSEGLTAARRLFPAAEMTETAAKAARTAATSEISNAVADSGELAQVAQTKLTNLAEQEAIVNPSFKQQIDQIRLKAAQDVADQQVLRETAKTEGEVAKNKLAAAKAEQKAVKAPGRGKPSAKSILDDLSSLADEGTPAAESVAAPVAEDGASALERQLQGTKTLVDQGKSISEIGEMRPSTIGLNTQINDALAKVNPDAAKLNDALTTATKSSDELSGWLDKYGDKSNVNKFERNQATRDTADSWRNKGEGWQSQVPEGEGNIGLARGTTNEWRGSEAGRRAWEKDFEAGRTPYHYGGMTSDEQSLADSAVDDITLRRMKRGGLSAPTGDEIINASEPVSAKIEKALKARSADINDDIAETAPMITRHEAAHADLVEALGPGAPPASAQRADGFRQAQQVSSQKAAEQTAATADAIGKQSPVSVGSQLLSKASSAGTMYEALRMMGVPLPDPHSIPVIGPLLSVYLKAKVLGKAFGRFGGKVAESSETVIASKAAAIRQSVYKAIDAGLAGSAKVTKVAASQAGAAAILGHKLFAPEGPTESPAPYTSQPEAGSLGDLYLARAAEVQASQRPGAIADAIKARIQTSDPEVLAQIIETKTRQLNYLASVMPRPTAPSGLLDGRVWLPAKQDLLRWVTSIAATNNPDGVLERASVGLATQDELDAVKNVYPALYADGQKRVIQQVADGKGQNLTTVQRAALSRTWGLPLDSSASPERTAWLQATYKPPAPPPQPSGPIPQSTIAGPITIGQRSLTPLDSR